MNTLSYTCRVTDCNERWMPKKFRNGYCNKHRLRLRRTGSPTTTSSRDPRPSVRGNEIAMIPIGITNNGVRAIVDIQHADLDRYKWHLSSKGYAVTRIDGKLVRMHHLVIGKPPTGLVTDHIDRVKLNNRLCNLRHVTQKENVLNRTP